MHCSTEKSLEEPELGHLLTLTGNKIQFESSRPKYDLRRLAILCNTFDRNITLYQEMKSKPKVEVARADAPPIYDCNGPAYNQSESLEDCDLSNDSDDSVESSDLDTDSDESDEWDSTETIEGVPVADERRVRWLSTYGGTFYPVILQQV